MREVARGDKPYLRKSTDRKAQIRKAFVRTQFSGLICALRSVHFLRQGLSPRATSRTISFSIPIVFGINFLLIFTFEDFLNFFIFKLQCWWIENLRRTTTLLETHRLTVHSASLLYSSASKQHKFPDTSRAGMSAWIRVLEAETDRHTGALEN